MDIVNFCSKSNKKMSIFLVDSLHHSMLTIIVSLTALATISSFALSFSLKNKEMIVSQYDPVFFASDNDRKNFLNIALSNLSPQNLFVEISCYFVNKKIFKVLPLKTGKPNNSTSIRTVSFMVNSMHLSDNIIEAKNSYTYDSGVYFKNNTKNSTKFILSVFSTHDFDGYRAQLTGTSTKAIGGSLDTIAGLQSHFRFVNSSEVHFFSQISSFFLGFLVISSGIYLLFNIKKRFPNYHEVLNILLSFTGFVVFAPMIMQNKKYSNYEYLLYPFFNILFKFIITNHILNLKGTKVQKNVELYLGIFFSIYYFTELIQCVDKQAQISNSKTLNVPFSFTDFFYFFVIIIYIGIEIDTCINTPFANKPVLILLVIVNIELIAVSGLNLFLLAVMNASLSWNSQLLITMANVFSATIVTVAMYPSRNGQKAGNENDDEEPLVSTNTEF